MKRKTFTVAMVVCVFTTASYNAFAGNGCAAVTGFTLIQNDNAAGSFQNGSQVSMNCDWSLRAEVACPQDIQSVEFILNGSRLRIENIVAYSLEGDNNGNYNPVNLSPGSYTLKAIPWSADGASGTQGTSLTITFTVNSNACGSSNPQLPNIVLEDFASGFSQPTDIASAGDNRLFIVEKAGKIRITDLNGNKRSNDFLDISSSVGDEGFEQGLLGLAFDPHYATNRFFYVHYTDNNGNTRISRFQTSLDPNKGKSWTELVILTQPQPFDNHNAGQLRFGPDGYLYIALGDGGDAGDPFNNAQNPSTFLGKMLRIDVNGLDAGETYSIPATNPFVGGEEGWLEEIWASGFRNPFRFSFDAETGDLWIGDVGQNAWEEIDFQPASSTGGENYGWGCMEGNHFFKSDCDDNGIPFTAAVAENAHISEDCGGSIIGGFVYRGDEFPNMHGKYFYTDFCTGIISMVSKDDSDNWVNTPLFNGEPGSYSTFGEDMNGELYLANLTTGEIYHVTDGGSNGLKMAAEENLPENENMQISLFPNPNAGQFTVQFNALQEDEASVKVLNELGQEIWVDRQSIAEGANWFSISSDRFAAGIYTLQIFTSGKILTNRFVVAHQ